MGYSTTFAGEFKLNKPLHPKLDRFLRAFANTRRMKRRLNTDMYGEEGEFFVPYDSKECGQERTTDIIDYNEPPVTQPGLWCQWVPNDKGTEIIWDGGEKFYNYVEWITYIVDKFLAPNGYVLNGMVSWEGEEKGDEGNIIIKDNVITIEGEPGR